MTPCRDQNKKDLYETLLPPPGKNFFTFCLCFPDSFISISFIGGNFPKHGWNDISAEYLIDGRIGVAGVANVGRPCFCVF